MSSFVVLFALILGLGLILVLAIGIMAIPRWAARRREAGSGALSRWTVLVLCVVFVPMFFIVLGAMMIGGGNWRVKWWVTPDAQNAPDEIKAKEVLMSVPILPLPPVPPVTGRFGMVKMGPSRFIVTVLLLDHVGDQFRTLDGGSFTCDWPSPENRWKLAGRVCGTRVELEPNLGEFIKYKPDNGDPPFVYCSMPATTTNQYLSWACSGLPLALDTINEVEIGRKSGKDADSLHPKTLADVGPGVRLVVHLTRVDPSDPLRPVSATEWLSGDAKRLPFHAAGQKLSSRIESVEPTSAAEAE